MNKFSKLYAALLIGVFAVGTSACTDVSVDPLSTTTSANVFEDEGAYLAFLAKLYGGLALSGQDGPAGDPDIENIDEGFSQYLRLYWQLQQLPTDEALIAWSDDGVQTLHAHSWTSSNQFTTAMYDRVFFQVSLVNEFLRETTDEKLLERNVRDDLRAEIQQYRAEARFLRALSYWHGIDLYGDIPLVTEENEIGTEAPEQSTRAEIFAYIEDELTEIQSALPAPGQGAYGRADQGAVAMLLAKLYLNAEVYVGENRYADVISALAPVLAPGGYQLDDVYHHLFLADNHTSPEIIFAIPQDGQNTQTFGGTTFLTHAPVGGQMNPADYGLDFGWGGIRTTSALVDLFPDVTGAADSRALFFTEGQSLVINNVSVFTDGYAIPKYQNVTSQGVPGSNSTHPDTDYPMFRLGDAYLMYAEAVLRGGGGDGSIALDYVNALRERAYGDASGNLTSAELTLEFILDERARELYWEAHRRNDLIRFGQFTENGVWPWKGGVQAGRTTESYRNLFPIPASELRANPNLTQNPEY